MVRCRWRGRFALLKMRGKRRFVVGICRNEDLKMKTWRRCARIDCLYPPNAETVLGDGVVYKFVFIAIQPKNLFMLKTSRFLALLNSYDLFLTLRCAILSLRCQRKYGTAITKETLVSNVKAAPCLVLLRKISLPACQINFYGSARVKLATLRFAQTVTRLFPKNPALSAARQKGILSAP